MKLSWRGVNYLFLGSMLLEQTARGHLIAFTPLLLLELGLGADEVGAWTGLLVVLTMSIALPLTPFWGALAERYSRRPFIVRSSYLQAVAYLVIALADNLGWQIVARVILGFTYGNIATIMATQALLTPRNKLGSSLALIQVAQPIAASLGPPLGAALLPGIGLRGLFLLDAVLVFSSGLCMTFLLPEPAERQRTIPVLRRARGAVGQVWRDPPLRWNFIASFTVRGASSAIETFLPVRITQVASGDPAGAIGLILGAYGALTAAATWLVGRVVDRLEPARLFTYAMFWGTLVTAGVALAPNVWLVGVLAAARSVPAACAELVLMTHLARVLPPGQQTIVMNLAPLPRTFGVLLFPLLASLVVPLGIGAALLVGALGYAGSFLAGRRLMTTSASASQSQAIHPTTAPGPEHKPAS